MANEYVFIYVEMEVFSCKNVKYCNLHRKSLISTLFVNKFNDLWETVNN